MEDIPVLFQITLYSKLIPVNNLISRARARIFYKGLNRNSTYITDAIADQMIQSLPYVPVKGIYINEDDFSNHGESRQKGKAYGLVPSKDDMNFAWEEHDDDDGETRTYACCDVYLWTGLYKEASEIIDHPQSMELNPSSLLGAWKRADNGMKYFEYTFAEFLGLQCLGKDTEPCFEGAAFFSLIEDVQKLMALFTQYEKSQQDLLNNQEGGKTMNNFQLSHEDVYSALFVALNPNYNKDGDWKYEYHIGPVYDIYTLATVADSKDTYRVYYAKEGDNIVLGNKEKVFIIDVNESEYNALNALKALNNGNFEKVDETYQAVAADLDTANATIQTHEGTINTLTSEKSTLETANATLTAEVANHTTANATLTTEVETLKEFKLAQEKAEKQTIIDKFANILDDDDLKDYTDKLDTYSVSDLEKDLSVVFFKKQEGTFQFNVVPGAGKAGKPLSGADTLIAKHVNKEEK